jgi:outer membrane protein OmpA-like peptidoglycan-associated protein
MASGHRRGLIFAGCLLFWATGPVQAQDCSNIVGAFNQAVELGHEQDAQALLDSIAVHAECGHLQIQAQRRLAAFRLAAAQTLMARGRPYVDYERLLTEADRPRVLWQAAATLGDVRFGERRFAESATAFDNAIEIVKNETMTPNAPSKFEISGLFERAAQSRILAANAGRGRGGSDFVKTARNERDGTLGGVYSPSVRGVTPVIVPVPITFEYAKTTFTPIGEQAARELVEALKEQRPPRITLIGHTDVRGGAETNMKLSQARAETVADFLRQNGIEASIESIGKGPNEPMQLSDSSGLSQEDIYALNRRVEWRRGE